MPSSILGVVLRSDTAKNDVHKPIRWLWVVVGVLIMGTISVGSSFLFQRLVSLEDSWKCGILYNVIIASGFFTGGFVIALLSPGITVREPGLAAMVTFVMETAWLMWTKGKLFMSPRFVVSGLVLSFLAAYVGAWLGEGRERRRSLPESMDDGG